MNRREQLLPFRNTSSARLSATASASNPGQSCMIDAMLRRRRRTHLSDGDDTRVAAEILP